MTSDTSPATENRIPAMPPSAPDGKCLGSMESAMLEWLIAVAVVLAWTYYETRRQRR